MNITHVWIEEGCIPCGACTHSSPTVFAITDTWDTAIVRGLARADGIDSRNEAERSPLRIGFAAAETDAIREAAEGCPVEVIRFTSIAADVGADTARNATRSA